jgi:hypothetical protein
LQLNYSTLSKNHQHCSDFSGFELQEFDTLNLKIKEKYTSYEQRLARDNRKRAIGAGCPYNYP